MPSTKSGSGYAERDTSYEAPAAEDRPFGTAWQDTDGHFHAHDVGAQGDHMQAAYEAAKESGASHDAAMDEGLHTGAVLDFADHAGDTVPDAPSVIDAAVDAVVAIADAVGTGNG